MPIPSTTTKLARRTMRDEIYPTVREWILTGTLEPGEIVKDRELAERLGVSRTPVREALQRLRDEGLIEAESNRWTRVTYVDVETAQRAYPIVSALEELAVASACPRITAADHRAMETANERLARALDENRPVDASRADEEFHGVFLKRGGNPYITSVIADMRTKVRRVEIAYFDGPLVAAASVEDHRRVIAALRAGDAQAAATAIQRNWAESLKRLGRAHASRRDASATAE